MVQRKAPCKLSSQPESKDHAKLERRLSSHQQQDSRSNKGGDDPKKKKKLKKVKSINLSDLEGLEGSLVIQNMQPKKPIKNYMKPTSSSDSRKESLQVSTRSSTVSDKNRSPRRNPNSMPSISSPAKKLTRKSSLKTVRLVSCSKKCLNKATCSSTQKDLRFPVALDLNPGGTEAEGTSVLRVCPYSYCSLNGHCHPPLPPLKCFLSARRRAIKAQKSMRARVIVSCKRKGLENDEKGVDTGQTAIVPLIGEEDGFFVEIYDKSEKPIVEPRDYEEFRDIPREDLIRIPEVVNSLSLNEDGEAESIDQTHDSNSELGSEDDVDQLREGGDEIGSLYKKHEADSDENSGDFVDQHGNGDDKAEDVFEIHEFRLDVNFEAEIDKPGNLSVDEMDFMMKSLEYVECDQQVDEHDEENDSTLLEENCADLCSECCCILNNQSKEGENLVEPEDKIPKLGDPDMRWVGEIARDIDNSTDYSEDSDHDYSSNLGPYLGDEKYRDGFAFEKEAELLQEAEMLQEAYEAGDTGDSVAFHGADSNVAEERSISDAHCGSEGIASRVINQLAGVLESPESEEEQRQAVIDEGKDDSILDAKAAEEVLAEANQSTEIGIPVHILSPPDRNSKEENRNIEDISLLLEIELTDSCQCFTEKDDVSPGDHIYADMKNKADSTEDLGTQPENQFDERDKHMQATDFSGTEEIRLRSIGGDSDPINDILVTNESITFVLCSADRFDRIDNNEVISSIAKNTDRSFGETSSEEKTRWSIIRKERTEDSEDIEDYNQRGPNFLPIEPDLDAEKVDLRHQMMDERKNAEEWMIDYALQRAVTKLAPARKRKVALLVEAFETVQPLPIYEAPLQHATSSFSHGSPMQACS